MGKEIKNTPKDLAETFSNHFASVSEKLLAFDIRSSAVEPDIMLYQLEQNLQ